jgi:hypothetical protein
MDNTTLNTFNTLTGCFVGQYSSYCRDTPNGHFCIDGTATLKYNLADNIGKLLTLIVKQNIINQVSRPVIAPIKLGNNWVVRRRHCPVHSVPSTRGINCI